MQQSENKRLKVSKVRIFGIEKAICRGGEAPPVSYGFNHEKIFLTGFA